MKKIGVWLDKEKAHIVYLENSNEKMETIISEVENFRPVGGSGTRFKGGPQDVIQDSKFSDREKHQLKRYFKRIAETIKEADAIALFGPADTNLKLKKELSENYSLLAKKIKTVEKADSMTNNQVKALVRNFFNS